MNTNLSQIGEATMKNPSAIVSPHSGSRFPKAPSVIEIDPNQRKLAAALAFQMAGRGENPTRQRRIEAQLMTALQIIGGRIEAFSAQ